MSMDFWCMFGWLCATLAQAHVGDHTGTSTYVGVEEASQRGTSLVAPCPASPSWCICICICLSKALYWLAMAIDDWSHLNTIFDLLAPKKWVKWRVKSLAFPKISNVSCRAEEVLSTLSMSCLCICAFIAKAAQGSGSERKPAPISDLPSLCLPWQLGLGPGFGQTHSHHM